MTPALLRIERQELGATVLLRLSGELDLSSVDVLEMAVASLADSPVRHLIVDLHGLRFLDASGLHALSAIDRAARSNGHNASFVRATPGVQRIFDVLGLGDRFVFVDDVGELRPPEQTRSA